MMSTSRLFLGFFLGTIAITFFESQACSAQQSDPEKQKLQDEKDKADLQKSIADDKKAIAQDQADTIKSQYGISTDKLPQGSGTVGDKVSIEASILAYASANKAAGLIAGKLSCTGKVYFFDSKQMNDIWASTVLKEQLKQIVRQGNELKNGPTAGEFIPVGPAIEAGLSLLSLFKSDVTMQGIAVTPDDLALQAAVASELKSRCPSMSVVQGAYFEGDIIGLDKGGLLRGWGDAVSVRNSVNAQLLRAQADLKKAQSNLDETKTKLDANKKAAPGLQAAVKRLEDENNPAKKKELEAARKAVKDNLEEAAKLKADIDGATPAVAKLQNYIDQAAAFVNGVDALNASLSKVDDSGLSLLNRLLRAEALTGGQLKDDDRFLSVHFVALGGNSITRKNFFKTSISFTGGTVVDYIFTDRTGAVIQSGVLPLYGKKVSEGDLNKTLP